MSNIFSKIYASVLVTAVYAMKNYPTMVISSLLTPFSLLIFVILISKGALLDIAIIGAILSTMISSGIVLQIDLSHLKNDFRMQDMIVSSPTSAFIYIFGMSISELVYNLPTFAILITLAVFFVHVQIISVLTIILVMCMSFAFSTSLGFLISTFSSDMMQSWTFSGILTILLTTISPIYYPITYIPLPFRYIAYLSPTTYAAEIAQNALGSLKLPVSMLIINWIVLIALSAIILTVAIKKNRWREK